MTPEFTNPNDTEAVNAFYSKIRHDIDGYGLSLVAVTAESEDDIPFVYTIGNHEKNLPELLFIGNFSPHVAGEILNRISKHMHDVGATPTEFNLGGKYPVLLHRAGDAAKADYTIQASQFHETTDYSVYQVTAPDPQGNYPENDGCEPRFRVPIL